ncbi:MAG: hypothetical protein K2F64_05625 [Muribaculaceae bacterium]|nr:hypothetical protein [Muribaculaceae bacterium]
MQRLLTAYHAKLIKIPLFAKMKKLPTNKYCGQSGGLLILQLYSGAIPDIEFFLEFFGIVGWNPTESGSAAPF